MKIRTTTLADLAGVIACADLAFGAVSPSHPINPDIGVNHDFRPEILDGSIYVISAGASVLGYISLRQIADHLFVDGVAVLPKYQGQGLGTQLLAFAEQEALRLGLDSIRLFTSQTFADHFEFYRRRGYCETDRCHDDGFPRVFYSKDASRRTPAAATV